MTLSLDSLDQAYAYARGGVACTQGD